MADVFLSYSRQDRDVAEKLAKALMTAGHSVWFDRNIHLRFEGGENASTLWTARAENGDGSVLDVQKRMGDRAAFVASCAFRRRSNEAAESRSKALSLCLRACEQILATFEFQASDPERAKRMEAARASAARAHEIDPNNSDAMLAMSLVDGDPNYLKVREIWLRRALESDADPDVTVVFDLACEQAAKSGDAPFTDTYYLFWPEMQEFRRNPRFWVLARESGLVDYWLDSGRWPDFCSEPDLPFDCSVQAEQARSARRPCP